MNCLEQTYHPKNWSDICSIKNDEMYKYNDELIALIDDIKTYDTYQYNLINIRNKLLIKERISIIYYNNHYLIDSLDENKVMFAVDITKFNYIKQNDRKNKLKNILK